MMVSQTNFSVFLKINDGKNINIFVKMLILLKYMFDIRI